MLATISPAAKKYYRPLAEAQRRALAERVALLRAEQRAQLARRSPLSCEPPAALLARIAAPVPPYARPAGTAALMAIIADVTAAHGVSLDEVRGRARGMRRMAARMELYWRGVVECGLSYPKVGRALAKDHASVMYGVAAVDAVFRDAFGVFGAAALAITPERRRAAIATAWCGPRDTRARRQERAEWLAEIFVQAGMEVPTA